MKSTTIYIYIYLDNGDCGGDEGDDDNGNNDNDNNDNNNGNDVMTMIISLNNNFI
jgi:hypothetical protein